MPSSTLEWIAVGGLIGVLVGFATVGIVLARRRPAYASPRDAAIAAITAVLMAGAGAIVVSERRRSMTPAPIVTPAPDMGSMPHAPASMYAAPDEPTQSATTERLQSEWDRMFGPPPGGS